PTLDSGVDETGLNFYCVGAAADPLGCQDGCAGATERVEHDVAARGTVPDSIGHQRDRFDRRMALQLVEAPRAKRVDAGVMPDIGARTAGAAKLDIVQMRRVANTKHTNELVGAAVERALAGVGLRPNHQIQYLVVNRATRLQQFSEMSPIDADEMDRAVARH